MCDVHNNQDCGDGSDESSEACYEKGKHTVTD